MTSGWIGQRRSPRPHRLPVRPADFLAGPRLRTAPKVANDLYRGPPTPYKLAYSFRRYGTALLPWVRAALWAVELSEHIPWSAGQQGASSWDFTGWSQIHNCGASHQLFNGNAGLLPCGFNAAVTPAQWSALDNQMWTQASGPNNIYQLRFGKDYDDQTSPGFIRFRADAVYQRIQPNTQPAPPVPLISAPARPGAAVASMPLATPALTLWPDLAPIQAASPQPLPIPYRLLPYVRPHPRTPRQNQRQVLDLPVIPAPHHPPMAAKPLDYPTAVIGSRNALGARPRPYHALRPPARREKEAKITVRGLPTTLKLLSAATEFADIVSAVYDALPWQYRLRYPGTSYVLRNPSPQQKLLAIYRNWDHLDKERAVLNIHLDRIEDMVYGSIGRAGNRVSRDNRPFGELPIGYQFGPAL